MSGLAVFAVEVGAVAVLVPPGAFVGQGTVSDSDVVVSVFRGEGSTLVVAQRVTWERETERGFSNVWQRWHMAEEDNGVMGAIKHEVEMERHDSGGGREEVLQQPLTVYLGGEL